MVNFVLIKEILLVLVEILDAFVEILLLILLNCPESPLICETDRLPVE